MKRIIVALIFVLASVMPSRAQKADSLRCGSELLRCGSESFRVVQLIAPAVLIGAGTAITFTDWGEKNVNLAVRNYVLENDFHGTWIDHVTCMLPSVAHLALGWMGVPARHSGKERIALFATASAMQLGTVRGLKHALDVQRPDGSNDHSFPSNHTAFAFMGAEMMRLEYGPWWGLGAYTVATATGLMRVYNNRHWAGDVLAGAGFGILSAQAAYWLLPLERKLFNWDAVCIPYAAPGNAGVSVSWVF